MAKFIKEFYDFMSFLEGKNIASKRPPEQIDAAVNYVIADVVGKLINQYPKTKMISGLLDEFKRRADVTISNGIGSLPPDYLLHREAYALEPSPSAGRKVTIVEDAFWNNRLNRKTAPVSPTNIIARIEWTKETTPAKIIEVKPSTVTKIELLYIKQPAKVKYAYIPVGSVYQYVDADSVDIEFNILAYPMLMTRVLSMISVNLREGQLTQEMEVFKQQQQQ